MKCIRGLACVLLCSLCRAFSAEVARSAIVTGANGYLGKALVHEMLQPDDNDLPHRQIICLVRASRVEQESKYWEIVQSEASAACAAHIRVLPYDMMDGGVTLRAALEVLDGPTCVYHVASKFGPCEDHKQAALENVQGTKDLVQTVGDHMAQSARRHKIVLTSSMAAVRGSGQTPLNGVFYTAEDWNILSELGANWGASYQWSKCESERCAWELAKKLDLPMVTLCPSFIFGQAMDKTSSTSFSLEFVEGWLRGTAPVQSRLFVDVRDVARAHMRAGMLEAVNGQRFIVSPDARVPSKDVAEWLQQVSEEHDELDAARVHYDAEFQGGAIPIGEKEVDGAERLETVLGVRLHPLKETIIEMAKSLV